MSTLMTNEPRAPRKFRVAGHVRFADGTPAFGIKVAAFDRDFRTEELLGETQTERSGAYRIEYSDQQRLNQERGTADLVVKVVDVDGATLVSSPIVFDAPEEVAIDLVIALERKIPPTLFERLESAVEPLLHHVTIEELEEDQQRQDVTYLSGKTGYDNRSLARFLLAPQLARRGIDKEFWFALLGSSFFEYSEKESLKANLAKVSDALPTLDTGAVRKALASSLNRREIPASLRERTDAWTEAFLELMARSALRDAKSRTFAGMALEHAGIDSEDKQARFARLFNEHKALTPELLAALAKDQTFKEPELADLRTSYRLAEFTRGDFSVVRMLKEQFNIHRPEEVRKLAKQSEHEWVELVEREHRAGNINLPLGLSKPAGSLRLPEAELYAKTLESHFREAFPTAAFAGGLERALSNGGARGLRHADSLRQIMDRHPEFDLLRTPVDEFLSKSIRPEFQSLAKDATFRLELKGLTRVFKLAPTFDAADSLLADGLHSAQMIYRLGESEFVRRWAKRPGFSVDSARRTWNRAADTHAALLTLVGDLAEFDAGNLPGVLKGNHPALEQFPNWANLFQSGDICHCGECRSALSPSAYFADLLMFLRDRKVKDILFERRPDLGYLELNCENARTTLPYVDVVCEILESVIASGENDVELAGLVALPPDAAAAKAAVGAALLAIGINVGRDFTLSQVDLNDANLWVVHGDDATYLLKKKTTATFFAEVLPNTKASSEELRAYPAYVNPKAYDKLRARKYPLTISLDLFPDADARGPEQRARSFALPFDLFGEEVRAAFKKCNLQRWDLMRTLRGPDVPNNPTDGDIAAEYFGISCDAAAAFDEKRLILQADRTPAGQQALWGENGNAGWLDALANVKTFLRKSGLEYEELLALLDLQFINPMRDVLIQHLDASCDTDQKVIQGLDPAKLDRIQRFLRLWRKLNGWKAWELDLAIRCPGIGAGALDEPFLVNLYYLGRLRSKFGEKPAISELCGLFDNVGVETHFTTLHEKRADGLYQSVFLNRKFTQPLAPAFDVAAVNVPGPTAEKISVHRPVILAALGMRETDLDLLAGLARASNGAAYITDDLTLVNLSFLWRHAWLARFLKLKAEEWKTVLKLLQQDVGTFANASAAWEFVERVDQLKATGLSPDELGWLLAADRSAKSAVKEADATRFLTKLRTELQTIRREYDSARYEFLNPPSDVDRLSALLTSLLQRLHRNESEGQFVIDTLRDDVQMEVSVADLPARFEFPDAITGTVRIRYDEPAAKLRFTGLMTDAQRTTLLTDPALAAVTGIAAYRQAIATFFQRPRLAMKFLDPLFIAPLSNLPAAIDFDALRDSALIQKISFDAEERVLRLVGILSAEEKAALDALSGDAEYLNAVNSLFTQQTAGGFPPESLWLQDGDLKFPLTAYLEDNLATAAMKDLAYLSKTLTESSVIREANAQLGLTEGLTRHLLTDYAILPDPLLVHLTGAFAATAGVVDYAAAKTTLDGWFWACRVAVLWKKWKLTLAEWARVRGLTPKAQLLDFATLPLNAELPMPPIERFLRTSRLLRFRETVPETGITLLEVLAKLSAGDYARQVDFAKDVELLNEAWPTASGTALVGALDLAYPKDYLLAESWERVRRAFYFIESLNADMTTVATFAAATMTEIHAKALKQLLRSKFSGDTWPTLTSEIQDALRERKRDALVAYLLTEPTPADAPTGKWENTNDLYAYYLLDVEMGACQLTSRLVQASGSVQLFVQRCFMGLEPKVKVQADGADGGSAWRWWKWMRKYRVWEANRKVFLWPENWIEPELKKDRSPFFKDLESELLQNEVNQHTIEPALENYLKRLDEVAQLEIAGFYQEDDGDNTVVHTFGRTTGTEPHTYYYRRYDYRQWTPWERVDLDIQGDYLIPAVVNKRLFLFWPIFTEVPDEASNTSDVPIPRSGDKIPTKKAMKKLRLQMAASDYRQGKWTPKRVSKGDYSSVPYDVEITRKHYAFYPLDRTAVDGRFGVQFEGWSADASGKRMVWLAGIFEISGCTGVPDRGDDLLSLSFVPLIRPEADSVGDYTNFLKWEERKVGDRSDSPDDDLALVNQFADQEPRLTPVLNQTPGIFKVSPPWHLSYFDRLCLDASGVSTGRAALGQKTPVGGWLPFFYSDKKRSFLVLPCLSRSGEGDQGIRCYYPDLKCEFRKLEDLLAESVRTHVDAIDVSALSAEQRKQWETLLQKDVPDETVPPFSDEEIREHMVRYFMREKHFDMADTWLAQFQSRQLHFRNYYHPFVCDFAKLIYNPLQGTSGLMRRGTQLKDSGFSFPRIYQPTARVVDPSSPDYYPKEVVDFSPDGAYSSYNWELFFHAPLLIANSLSKNQRFEEARDWYHYIFNPLGVESPAPGGPAMSKYWITKPFFEATYPQYVQQRIENILRMLAGDTNVPGYSDEAKKALERQVFYWRTDPFEPHLIANYRTVAYQKTVFMRYLDNLIAWGDYLFRQDNMESVNEATQLYILAAELLGRRPMRITPQEKLPLASFNELEKQFDAFSNALVEFENLIPPSSGTSETGPESAPLPMLYFCIPHNEKMLGYWDTVADRLYKIRHCMNMDGVVRQLALFEPPLDPGALVKAVAAGLDIGAALAGLNAPLPLYRFNVLVQKANEVCNDVKALGAALLSALEKKDSEGLSLLRQSQETRVLEAVKMVREEQIEEAKENAASLNYSKELADIEKKYYESREFMNAGETIALALNSASTAIDAGIARGYALAGGLKLFPQYHVGGSGFGGSPHATVSTGGQSFGESAEDLVKTLESIARALDKGAGIAGTVASYTRRQDEWEFQRDLAVKEIKQLERSIAAAELRIAIAEKELDNHVSQIENAQAIDAFMRSKYTNEELYQWQVGQISGVYFQTYKLAYDLAQRAERCFRFELGLLDSNFISFGYWDSLKNGLLSAEKLQYDLRRLESAYIDQNRREFELTKHVSLLQLDPLELVRLREVGRCTFQLPEEIFDRDYPGHYFRRIKTVSVTLPCVAGPYTTISCTLRLLKNSIRINTDNGESGYPRNSDDAGLPTDDPRFVENNIPVKAIASSSAQNDSGMFELSFRDDRYLPFEGAGVTSKWSLELFNDLPANKPYPANWDFGRPLRQFDYSSITDAVLHVRYTSREDAGNFKNGAIAHLREYFSKDGTVRSVLALDLRRDFGTQWSRFLNPPNPVNGNVFELEMSADRFPMRDAGKTLKVNAICLLARSTDPGNYSVTLTPPLPAPPPAGANVIPLATDSSYGGLHFGQKDATAAAIEIAPADPPVTWVLKVTRPSGGKVIEEPVKFEDLILVLGYEWQ